MILNPAVAQKLQNLADEMADVDTQAFADRWYQRAKAFLSATLGTEEATNFATLYGGDWYETTALRRGHLEGLAARAEMPGSSASARELDDRSSRQSSRKVFVVHGRDDAAKEGVARFVEKMGLQPIILHEQPNGGRTIIEKFEMYSDDVAFAVVLLTPDDVGYQAGDSSKIKARARQNVIMELGYFIGRLGRTRVCALHKGQIELPSDYQGVVYVPLDDAGAWRTKLAQEFVQAKISIDLKGLVAG
jgi:predicted nucleotide-binding protein